jgi:hypothetical protein
MISVWPLKPLLNLRALVKVGTRMIQLQRLNKHLNGFQENQIQNGTKKLILYPLEEYYADFRTLTSLLFTDVKIISLEEEDQMVNGKETTLDS